MQNEQLCSIALSLCPGIGKIGAKRLVDALGSASSVFQHRKEIQEIIPDAQSSVVSSLDCPEAFARAEKEMAFIEKNRLTCLTLQDDRYPARLRECEDAPIVLFFKGNCDLNRKHIINMVGTRRASNYGKQFCEDFVAQLSALCPDILIISGLAYGIDINAHRAALQHGMSTVAVLAHGLDRIYPSVHRKTAVDMLEQGGLLTEFLTETTPERYNFVSRNRIVAGMADATIVVESASKGGSLITADLATGYNRDCFAVPGRVGDETSVGCNQLIRDNVAGLLLSAEDFLTTMGWNTVPDAHIEAVQRSLFPDLSPEEASVVQILQQNEDDMPINALIHASGFPMSKISLLLFDLEMKGVLKALPGNMYHLLNI